MKTQDRGHIVILVENLPVPFDRRVWMESCALRDAGFTVSVISPCKADEPNPVQTIDGIDVYRYPIREASAKVGFICEYRYAMKHTARFLKQVWAKQPFDVIQSCNPPDLFWMLARKYKKRHGVKYVFDHHDLCPELYESKFGKRGLLWKALGWVERKQFQHAAAVISTNESYRDVAIQRGGKDPANVQVVRSGPLISRFKPVPADPTLKRGKQHLGVYLGVMGPQDGVDYALRAVRHALDAGLTDTHFAFIGGGTEVEFLHQLVTELDLADHVEFTGRISDEDLFTYFSTADLGIAPDPAGPLNSVSAMNKIVEYMAFGLPIVSFDLLESRRTAETAAWYVGSNDPKAMGDAMIALLDDPEERRTMGQIGRNRFEATLAWEHQSRKLIGLYERLLAAPARVSLDAAAAASTRSVTPASPAPGAAPVPAPAPASTSPAPPVRPPVPTPSTLVADARHTES